MPPSSPVLFLSFSFFFPPSSSVVGPGTADFSPYLYDMSVWYHFMESEAPSYVDTKSSCAAWCRLRPDAGGDPCNCFALVDGACYVGDITRTSSGIGNKQRDAVVYIDQVFLENQLELSFVKVENLTDLSSFQQRFFFPDPEEYSGIGLLRCYELCFIIYQATCHFFLYEGDECALGTIEAEHSPGAALTSSAPWTVYALINDNTIDEYDPPFITGGLENMAATEWNHYIYMVIDGVTEDQCMAHCYLRVHEACQYYVHVGTKCFLGDMRTEPADVVPTGHTSTVAALVVYKEAISDHFLYLDSETMDNHDYPWQRYIYHKTTQWRPTSLQACSAYCNLQPREECQFVVYTGAYCHLGRVGLDPALAVTVHDKDSQQEAYIFLDNVKRIAYADTDYLEVPNVHMDTWEKFIRLSNKEPDDKHTCAAYCSLEYFSSYYGNCDLFVWDAEGTGEFCRLGSIKYRYNGHSGPSGNHTVSIKKASLVQEDFTASSMSGPDWAKHMYNPTNEDGQK